MVLDQSHELAGHEEASAVEVAFAVGVRVVPDLRERGKTLI